MTVKLKSVPVHPKYTFRTPFVHLFKTAGNVFKSGNKE